MPEKTKREDEPEPSKENCAENSAEKNENGTWSEDQRKKNYYYDDAYGYEVYNPDEDDEED